MQNTATPSNAHRQTLSLALLAGLGILVSSVGILLVQPSTLAWLPHGYLTPVLALEFSTDIGMVRQMFGGEHQAIAAMMQVIRWDMAFLVCYAVFLVTVVCTLISQGILRYIALFFAVIAPVADVAENLQLLALLEHLQNASVKADAPIDFTDLRLATVVKFGAVAIVHIRLLRAVMPLGRYGRILSAFLLGSVFATGASFYTVPFALDAAVAFTAISWCLLWGMMLIRLRSN